MYNPDFISLVVGLDGYLVDKLREVIVKRKSTQLFCSTIYLLFLESFLPIQKKQIIVFNFWLYLCM